MIPFRDTLLDFSMNERGLLKLKNVTLKSHLSGSRKIPFLEHQFRRRVSNIVNPLISRTSATTSRRVANLLKFPNLNFGKYQHFASSGRVKLYSYAGRSTWLFSQGFLLLSMDKDLILAHNHLCIYAMVVEIRNRKPRPLLFL